MVFQWALSLNSEFTRQNLFCNPPALAGGSLDYFIKQKRAERAPVGGKTPDILATKRQAYISQMRTFPDMQEKCERKAGGGVGRGHFVICRVGCSK